MVLSAATIPIFGLVLARVSGLFVVAPVFGAKQVPAQAKIGLAVMVSLVFTPLQLRIAPAAPTSDIVYGIMAGREVLVGLALGLAVAVIFHGIQMGSNLVGVQIGFGLGGVLNPTTGQESSVIDGFYMVLATVIFLTANGHHAMLAALAHTFDVMPVASAQSLSVNPLQVMALIQSVFVIALRIAMPAIAALLLADVGLGLVGKAAPQMQIMIVGAPVKIAVGLLMLSLSTPTSAMLMDAVFRGLNTSIGKLVSG